MKVAIFNDTSSYHHIGCLAVSNSHDRMLAEAGASIEYRHYVDEFHDLWRGDEKSTRDFLANSSLAAEIEAVDAVVVNGEGTIHHGSGLHLLAILSYAQELGKRTYLVNAVLQEVPIYHGVLSKLDDLTVREINSFKYLAALGIESRVVLDSIMGAHFNPGVDEEYRNKVIVTDCHLSREDVKAVLERACATFSSELVYFPLEYENSVNDWQDTLKKFRAAKLIITGRHHAVYLALLAGTPFVALPSNTWKIEGTLAQLGGLSAMWDGSDIVDVANSAISHPETYAPIFKHELLSTPLTTFDRLKNNGLPKSLLDLDVYKNLAVGFLKPLSDVFLLGSIASLALFKNHSLATRFVFGGIPYSCPQDLTLDKNGLEVVVPQLINDVDSIVCIDAIFDDSGFDYLVRLAIDKLRPGGRLIVRCSDEMFVRCFSTADNVDCSKTSDLEVLGLLLESSLRVQSLQRNQAEQDWVCSFFRNPLLPYAFPYEERNLPAFNGKTHLVDFTKYYENPWVVHSIVEIPWRVKNTKQLFKLAGQLLAQSSADSADQGAALAILGWRYFEEDSSNIPSDWHVAVDKYLVNERLDNPHVRRWCISLSYLQARFYQRTTMQQRSLASYQKVVNTAVINITPTLGTKQVNAAFQAGMIYWEADNHEQATRSWQEGIKLAFNCLNSDLLEFVGNMDHPFLFSLNDAVEIIDAAVQCASALNIAARKSVASESSISFALKNVSQNALRSALNRVTTEWLECDALRLDLEERLAYTLAAKNYAEELAFGRLDEINRLCAYNQALLDQLKLTEDAKAYAESLAFSRLAELDALRNEKGN
ncbi:polysaccharide pyruvyl transferase family protein [Pseudomonas cucumis]|uniref:polysaccharide pyruvyl transferase family protein n=1 Tax=Pseudomonas cucumis TaxID=2954082 RepID=UPI002735B04B|nr:polysaccharide pyruvyl transferase family protein [Pseudomonas cucumis]WLG88969.1 polysaccharide pyruvyl transferase family protein [Pseudomonas cucumis]